MFASVGRAARITGAVLRHHANSSVQLDGDARTFSAVYACSAPNASPYGDVVTVFEHTLSMCVANVSRIVEGEVLMVVGPNWPAGQRCRITTDVVPDAGGWAVFVIVPLPSSPIPIAQDGADHV